MTNEPAGGRSLLLRVVWSTALTAAVGSAIAGLTAGLATANLLDEHEEDLQRIATLRFAQEIEEEERDGGETLQGAVADELGDLDYVGARGVVHRAGERLAGDPALSPRPAGTCDRTEIEGGLYRVCTVAHQGRDVTLAVSTAHTRSIESLFAYATVASIVFGVLTGMLLGRFATRWALHPFASLRERVGLVKPDAPETSVLEPPADYREIEDLRRAVVDLVERLGGALGQAQRFAAQASHELRTPLTSLGGELDLLIEAGAPVDPSSLARLRERVRTMSLLVERLLVLAAPPLTSGGEAVDLDDVAEEAVRELPEAARPRVSLDRSEDVLVRGDATLLRLAVSNALENALKFSSDHVDLRVGGDAAEAWIEVEDRGLGIPEAERARVFEPFYRSPAVRRKGIGGYGIGLALIAHVVDGHQGRVELRRVPRGACVRIVLPRWTIEPSLNTT